MKKALILAVAMLFVASAAMAATVVGTKHDIRLYVAGEGTTQVCVFCHVPHQAAAATSQDPLWNHMDSAVAAYGVYGSTTLNANMAAAEIAGAIGSLSVSALCMTCHDGTVAVNSLYNAPNDGNAGTLNTITGVANLGSNLTDDHPVNFTYDAALATADGGLRTPVSTSRVDATNNVMLFGGMVQCASCHDVHNNTNIPFLTQGNSGSAMCIVCHNK